MNAISIRSIRSIGMAIWMNRRHLFSICLLKLPLSRVVDWLIDLVFRVRHVMISFFVF